MQTEVMPLSHHFSLSDQSLVELIAGRDPYFQMAKLQKISLFDGDMLATMAQLHSSSREEMRILTGRKISSMGGVNETSEESNETSGKINGTSEESNENFGRIKSLFHAE